MPEYQEQSGTDKGGNPKFTTYSYKKRNSAASGTRRGKKRKKKEERLAVDVSKLRIKKA